MSLHKTQNHSILIFTPTYNESENIEKLINELVALELPADILVIDDNSPDGTAQLVRKFALGNPSVSLIQRPSKLGIGSAHLLAIQEAYVMGYSTLISMDADFSHQPTDLIRFVNSAGDADIVIGNRFSEDESLGGWSFSRKLMTHMGHRLTKLLLRMPFDASGGLRLYKLDKIDRRIFESLRSRDYEFFFESLYLLYTSGFKIIQLPVVLPARAYGRSKMRLKHMIRGVTRLFRLGL